MMTGTRTVASVFFSGSDGNRRNLSSEVLKGNRMYDKSGVKVVMAALLLWMAVKPQAASGEITGLIWKKSADLDVLAIAPAGDVDGDSISDVFAGSRDHLVYCLSGDVNKQGAIIWSWNFGAPVWTVARIPDVNGDGVDDCLAGCADNTLYCLSGRSVNGLSEKLWSYAVDGDVFTVTFLNDINDDGICDVVMGTNDDRVYCLDGQYGLALWIYADTEAGAIKSVCRIPDVNNDGLDDCLAGGENDRILCLSGDAGAEGELIWYSQAGSTILSVATVPDVDNDGIHDCAAGGEDDYVYLISGGGSGRNKPVWTSRTGSTVKTVAGVSDVNSDGVPDLLAGGEDNQARCFSGVNGEVIWERMFTSTVLTVTSFEDVTENGTPDCIAGAENDTIYCLDGQTGERIWRYGTGGAVTCVAPIADLNGNQSSDVLGGSTDSYVYALDGRSMVQETVGAPVMLSGALSGETGQSLLFQAGGAVSNLGHALEYRFDWGDGDYSAWGDSSQSHAWQSAGDYTVRAQARCRDHPSVASDWSGGVSVHIEWPSAIDREPGKPVPEAFGLDQNYPNPFNAGTRIAYRIPKACRVQIRIFSVHSEMIRTLADAWHAPGFYHVEWDGKASSGTPMPSGMYVYQMKGGDWVSAGEMILLK